MLQNLGLSVCTGFNKICCQYDKQKIEFLGVLEIVYFVMENSWNFVLEKLYEPWTTYRQNTLRGDGRKYEIVQHWDKTH